MALRHHVPEKSGMGLVGAPIAGKTKIAVEMKPAAARPKQFREMTPIPLLRIPNVLTLSHCIRSPELLRQREDVDAVVAAGRVRFGRQAELHRCHSAAARRDRDILPAVD